MKKVFLLLCILLSINFVYSLPRTFETSLQGVSFHLDSEDLESHDLIIKGWRSNHLFSKSTFKGTIYLDDLEMLPFETKTGHLEVLMVINQGDVRTYGSMIMGHDFESYVINVTEEGQWGSSDGRVMAFPSRTKEQAMPLIKSLYSLDNWAKNINLPD